MESMNNVDNTLVHISHLHPLKLVASPEPRPICHACNMLCADQSYGCVYCYYFLHITCAITQRSMNHPSHPSHTLNLELTPAYPHGQYGCDACGVSGSSFCLRCRECSYDLHLPCAAVPHQLKHRSHRHPLTLVYKNPYPSGGEAYCNLCLKYLDCNKWFYLCHSCDFGGHVGCFSPERPEVMSPGLQAPPQQPQSQLQTHGGAQGSANERSIMQQLQRQMMSTQASMMFANTMNNAGQDIRSLFDNSMVWRWNIH